MDDDLLLKAKRLLEGVPEGWWAVHREGQYDLDEFDAPVRVVVVGPAGITIPGASEDDADFIAHAPLLLTELVAEVEKLRLRLWFDAS